MYRGYERNSEETRITIPLNQGETQIGKAQFPEIGLQQFLWRVMAANHLYFGRKSGDVTLPGVQTQPAPSLLLCLRQKPTGTDLDPREIHQLMNCTLNIELLTSIYIPQKIQSPI